MPATPEPRSSASGRGVTRRAFVAAAVATLLAASAASGGSDRPRIYALTGATVVPSPGKTIEGCTVVLRDGLIEAVGRRAAIPPDAVEIDAAERWIYPGLIDATSRLELAASESKSEGARSGAVHALARIHPEQRLRDRLRPFEDDLLREVERLRGLGFAAVLITPREGILRGSSVAVQLVEEQTVARMILRDDVAQHAAFEWGRFGDDYPTSLMGAVAAFRQTLLDASRHATWSRRYDEDPRGLRRPERHAAFEALAGIVDGRLPVFFEVDHPRDVLLADRLAREFDLELVVAASGHEWEIAEQIAATGRPLLLPVVFPDKPEVDEPNEALEVSRRTLRRYVEAASGPRRLHEAGVTFALTTRGLKTTADFRKNLRAMIEAGLPQETALAALTTVPAGLLGLGRMLGTLEPGKIANLVIADGPLFEEKTTLERVFVDGIDYEIESKKKPESDPDAVVDPRGEWSIVFDFGTGTIERGWTIRGAAGDHSGTAETQSGTVKFVSVELEGNLLTVVYPARGGRPQMEVSVIVEGDSLEGTAEAGSRTVEIEGGRAGPQEGERW